MKKRLGAAALVAIGTFLGAAAVGTQVAYADEAQVKVCSRMEEFWPGGPVVCTRWTTCHLYEGYWWCDDGSFGGPSRPPLDPLRP